MGREVINEGGGAIIDGGAANIVAVVVFSVILLISCVNCIGSLFIYSVLTD